ncbi:hypothetical protein K458DRAFT_428933 [Lentithecium fluviatile CBS 122367]|uniref:Aldehyde dehydrogenase domain-containing protein n=1 Tax=Lentithecium fluviatile CBS 122367 TaxID=1168545 RepID=A0A6G1JD86_9PLEO|nr:hypothetical protein K458DRAFT_428933 [Lentithecium fluviatile CBS 122367]
MAIPNWFRPNVLKQVELEAVKKAHDTEYGLGAAIFTKGDTGMVRSNSSQDSCFRISFSG